MKATEYLKIQSVTKDMGRPRYFLGIVITHRKHGVVLSQQKHALDLPYETGLLSYKPVRTPMDTNADL